MLSKRIKKLISTILIIVTISLSSFIGYKTYLNNKYTNSIKTQQTHQLQVNKQVENWDYKINQFKNECHKTTKMLPLEGTVTIENTITTDDYIVKYQGDSNTIKFLADKLNDLKVKSMTVNTTYKYGFSYDINQFVKVECDKDGNLTIQINKEYLNLEYLDEQSDKTTINVQRSLLSGEFTYQQQQGIMNLTKDKTWKTIESNKETRDKTIEGTKDLLNDLGRRFGFKSVNVEVTDSENVVSNRDSNNGIKIKNITYRN